MTAHCVRYIVLFLIAGYKPVTTDTSQSNISCASDVKNPGDVQKTIYFAFMTTFSGSFVSSGTIPAVDLAIERVNNDSLLLQKYKLDYTMAVDTKV